MHSISSIFFSLFFLFLVSCQIGNEEAQDEMSNQNVDSLYLYYLETAQKYEKEESDSLAIIYYDSAIDLKPSHGVVNDRGLVKADVGDFEGALKDYDFAIQMGGEFETNRAYVLMEMGREVEAMGILEMELKKRNDTCGYLFDKAYFMTIKRDLLSFESYRNELNTRCPNSNLAVHVNANYIGLLLALQDTTKACKVLHYPIITDEIRETFSNIDCSKYEKDR